MAKKAKTKKRRSQTAKAALEKSRARLKWIVGLTTLMVGVGLVYSYTATRVIELGYEISRLQAEKVKTLRTYSKLRVELASLKAPERIEGLARGKLGLIQPPADRVVVLK